MRELFLECSSNNTEGILFIDDDAPRIVGQVGVWPLAWLTRLLECIPTDALRTPEQLTWIDALVRHLIALHAPGHDERSAEVARWLAKRIGEGVLHPPPTPQFAKICGLRGEKSLTHCQLLGWLTPPLRANRASSSLQVEGFLGRAFCQSRLAAALGDSYLTSRRGAS